MPIDAPLVSAITVSLLIVVTLCAITDVLEHRIPNIVLLPALLVAIVFNSLLAGLPGLLDCILGLVLGFAMLFPLYFLGGTSAGDVKLLAVVGALLGTNGALIAGVATLFFGGLFGVLFIAWRVIEPILTAHVAQWVRNAGATAPQQIGAMTRDRSRNAQFPYAPAIACGAYFSIWHLGYFSQVAG
jgi:prepilin peptidase CpaA